MIKKELKSIKHNIKWIDIEKPNLKELSKLQNTFYINPIDIKNCDKVTQRPKIINRQKYIFLIIHIPVFNRQTRQTTNAELDIFVTRDHLITLHPLPIVMLKKLLKDTKIEKVTNKNNPTGSLLYYILDRLFGELFEKVDHIAEHIDEIEDKIFSRQNVIKEILIIKRDIINFRKIIRPQRTALDALTKPNIQSFFKSNYSSQFSNVISTVIRLWNTLENHKEMIDILEDTNESMLSYQLNKIMTFLTIISVVLLPVTIIANFTSDTIILNNPIWAFSSIVSSFVVIIFAVYYMKKNKLM